MTILQCSASTIAREFETSGMSHTTTFDFANADITVDWIENNRFPTVVFNDDLGLSTTWTSQLAKRSPNAMGLNG